MSNQDNFELHYDGKSTQDHTMDIEVAMKIMASTNVLMKRVANKTAPKDQDFGMSVSAFKKGSFGLDFSVATDPEVASYILALIGFGASAVHGGILSYLDWKSEKEEVDFEIEELNDGTVRVTDTATGESKVTDKNVIALASDPKVIHQLHNILVEPFEKLDLDEVYISSNKTKILTFTQEKAKQVTSSNSKVVDIKSGKFESQVTIEQVSLTAGGKWRIKIPGHSKPVTARMKDEDFESKIALGLVTFKAKDQMEVLIDKQVETKPLRKNITYTIEKVNNHWHQE